MRKFQYNIYGQEELETISEDEIIEKYWEEWCILVSKARKNHLICREHCIEDFCTINWAWEID